MADSYAALQPQNDAAPLADFATSLYITRRIARGGWFAGIRRLAAIQAVAEGGWPRPDVGLAPMSSAGVPRRRV